MLTNKSVLGTFYLDTGKNFNGSETIRFQHKNNSFYAEIELSQNVMAVRFDPVEGYWCYIQDLVIVSDTKIILDYQVLNGYKLENNGIFFSTTDPQILIHNKNGFSKIIISCNIMVIFNPDFISSLQTSIEQLHSMIGQLRKHIDTSYVKKYYSCQRIEKLHLNFNGLNGHNNNGEGCIEFCCESIGNIPGVALNGTAEYSINDIIKKRAEIIAESKMFNLLGDQISDEVRSSTYTCSRCYHFQLKEWENEDHLLIHMINFNMYPAPCQSRCIYCEVHSGPMGKISNVNHEEQYKGMFNAIKYAQDNYMIAPNVVWHFGSGEITIHPYKDEMLSFVKNQAARFLTNCFIFDKQIAENLRTVPRSSIHFSIDAGTKDTRYKVRGVNNFDTVIDNLTKYSANCVQPNQITLKYIILLGINNNYDDYLGVIKIMESLKIRKLGLSYDFRERYLFDEKHRLLVIEASGKFVAALKKNNMTIQSYFPPDIYKEIDIFANELMKSNII
jgi:wyosine [tRNA(Phe)-imidazoG37] synthetase (radical SAM superfamily)